MQIIDLIVSDSHMKPTQLLSCHINQLNDFVNNQSPNQSGVSFKVDSNLTLGQWDNRT